MESKLPLGTCKQAIMKLESALADINEIMTDEDITEEQKNLFGILSEYTGNIIASIYNEVQKEMGEEEFISETIEMDAIDAWPGESTNIMDDTIE